MSEDTIERSVAEAEDGIPAEKLRRRGRPAIGDEAASTSSVRLPDDLVHFGPRAFRDRRCDEGEDDPSHADRVPDEVTLQSNTVPRFK